MYIAKVIIENFQSHQYTEIELSRGLNVLVGESDRGKSAVVRALRWLFENEPRGTGFIRGGTAKVRVTAVMEDGTTITRERSPGTNRYAIQKQSEEPIIYERFGKGVPDEVSALHGVAVIKLDNDLSLSLNFSQQLDSPFLLSSPGSLKAKVIGRLHSVHVIDAAARDVQQEMSQLQKEDARLVENISVLDKALEEYSDLPGLERCLISSKKILGKINNLNTRLLNLLRLKTELNRVIQNKNVSKTVLNRLTGLNKIRGELAKVENMLVKYNNLNSLMHKWLKINTYKKDQKLVLKKTNGILIGRRNYENAKEAFSEYREIRVLETVWKRVCSELAESRHTLGIIGNLEIAGIRMDLVMEKWFLKKSLTPLAKRFYILSNDLYKTRNLLINTKKIPIAIANMSSLSSKTYSLVKYKDLKIRLDDITQRIQKGQAYLLEREREIEKQAGDYVKLLNLLSRCPTCFNTVDCFTLKNIVFQLKKRSAGRDG